MDTVNINKLISDFENLPTLTSIGAYTIKDIDPLNVHVEVGSYLYHEVFHYLDKFVDDIKNIEPNADSSGLLGQYDNVQSDEEKGLFTDDFTSLMELLTDQYREIGFDLPDNLVVSVFVHYHSSVLETIIGFYGKFIPANISDVSDSAKEQSMLSVSFNCNKKDLFTGLKHVKLGVAKKKKGDPPGLLDINVRPDNLVLTTSGAKYTLECKANCYSKLIVPFPIIYDIVKNWKSSIIRFEFDRGKMVHGESIFESSLIQVIHPENQSAIDLPLNYGPGDLVKLRVKHSIAELERMNMLEKVEKAESEMDDNMIAAFKLLKYYGVKYPDIKNIVNLRLKD